MITPLLKAEEVTKILGISLRTLKRWEAGGRIRRVKLSKRAIRYDPKDVYRLIEDLKV